jgi:hypothetical protein
VVPMIEDSMMLATAGTAPLQRRSFPLFSDEA